MSDLSRNLLAPVLFGSLLTTAVTPVSAAVRLGDGLGTVQAYDANAQAVLLREQRVPLTPEAAKSLEEQLAVTARKAGTQFSARYTVIRGPSGEPMINEIYVFPSRSR